MTDLETVAQSIVDSQYRLVCACGKTILVGWVDIDLIQGRITFECSCGWSMLVDSNAKS